MRFLIGPSSPSATTHLLGHKPPNLLAELGIGGGRRAYQAVELLDGFRDRLGGRSGGCGRRCGWWGRSARSCGGGLQARDGLWQLDRRRSDVLKPGGSGFKSSEARSHVSPAHALEGSSLGDSQGEAAGQVSTYRLMSVVRLCMLLVAMVARDGAWRRLLSLSGSEWRLLVRLLAFLAAREFA